MRRAGLSSVDIIRAATVNGAWLLGMQKELGRLKKGYYADLIAVHGDPLADVETLAGSVKWVMRSGIVLADRRIHTWTAPNCDAPTALSSNR